MHTEHTEAEHHLGQRAGHGQLQAKHQPRAGPSSAVYGLFANLDTLKKAFTDDIGADGAQLLNCPGEGASPDTWHHDKTPTVTAGQIACATYKSRPNVIWSNNAKLMLSDVFGDPPALEDVYTWWTKFGG